MSPELSEYLPMIIGGIIGALIAIFVVMRMNRRAKVVTDENSGKDVLDEGAAPAQRNQALIDAPDAMADSGVSVPPAAPEPAPKPTPEPVATPAAEPAPPSAGDSGDELTRIKGLGPKIATMLREQGITTFAQIAGWSDEDVARIDAGLGRFAGRITRDQWVEQAKLLESGNESGFTEKFGQTR